MLDLGGSLGCEEDTTSPPTETFPCNQIHQPVCTRQGLHQKTVKNTSWSLDETFY